ncbi:MAG: hypothetical protein FWF05_07205 [Oscillospiraceae bacterium]|nr:hypothetical protein [Oscillospiraceae bacterium]
MRLKKIVCGLLALALALSLLAGCGKKDGLAFVGLPDGLAVNASMLSDTLQTATELYDAADFPLVAFDSVEGLYVYDVTVPGFYGVLIRYGDTVQYFAWQYYRITSQPKIAVRDYDGDGVKDLAAALLVNKGSLNRSEELHLVTLGENGFTDRVYTRDHLSSELKHTVSVSPKADGGEEEFVLLSRETSFAFSFPDRGSFQGLYFDGYHSFDVGDAITGRLRIGLVFSGDIAPVYGDGYTIKAEIRLSDGVLTAEDAKLIVE